MVFKTKGLDGFTKIMNEDGEEKRSKELRLEHCKMKRSERRGLSKKQRGRANDEEGGILKRHDVLHSTLGKT